MARAAGSQSSTVPLLTDPIICGQYTEMAMPVKNAATSGGIPLFVTCSREHRQAGHGPQNADRKIKFSIHFGNDRPLWSQQKHGWVTVRILGRFLFGDFARRR